MYSHKYKEKYPVIAICYDFDKTLSPKDMQAQGFIQDVGYDVNKFWQESNALAQANDMDTNLAYMYKMVEKSQGNFSLNRQVLADYGAKVELFPGVETWFKRIRDYGKSHNIIIEHYIISSGLKEMIEGTIMARRGEFEKIYASSFYFDDNGIAKWPAQAVNYTNKTQFLFRIEKGFLDINDPAVNDSITEKDIRVPFRNIVYIGDSETDIPCMKLVNSNGGHSICVYNPQTINMHNVEKLFNQRRIKYFAPADYREHSKLDLLIKNIIDKTVSFEKLYQCYLTDKETLQKNSNKKTLFKIDKTNHFKESFFYLFSQYF